MINEDNSPLGTHSTTPQFIKP